jgi:hypothetical protein
MESSLAFGRLPAIARLDIYTGKKGVDAVSQLPKPLERKNFSANR